MATLEPLTLKIMVKMVWIKPNQNRKWWQFWRPKFIEEPADNDKINPEHIQSIL